MDVKFNLFPFEYFSQYPSYRGLENWREQGASSTEGPTNSPANNTTNCPTLGPAKGPTHTFFSWVGRVERASVKVSEENSPSDP